MADKKTNYTHEKLIPKQVVDELSKLHFLMFS